MLYIKRLLTALLSLLLLAGGVRAQDSARLDQLIALPDKVFSALDKKSQGLEEKLTRQSERYLTRVQQQEKKIKRKLWKRDSVLARGLFTGVEEQYAQFKERAPAVGRYASVYSPHLDSLTTALTFLQKNNPTASPELRKYLKSLSDLQERFNYTQQVQQYLLERQRLLKEQLARVGMVKELKRVQKEVYYYQQQVREYKALWEDPGKWEAKLLEVVMKQPAFKEFFAQNSGLSQLFALPGTSSATPSSLQGLQTRASVQQSLQQRFGTGADVTAALRVNLQNAQGQLNALKDKAAQYTSGSFGNAGEGALPDFTPNGQRTNSLLQRIEVGTNVQSQRSHYFFPVTSDLGLSVGYKLNDKSVVGVGASYKLGLGEGWQHLKLSHQGVGLRSFVDYKLKGSLYVSGGYEQNYRSAIRSVAQLQDQSSWEASGLVGLSKKYKVSKKLKGDMKLLWDFMSYQQVPRTQAVLFRVGYSLK